MDYVSFGRTGLKVSRLCLGCMSYGSTEWRPWVLDERDAKPFFKKALKAGINFFDTADFYGLGRSEEVTGKHLKSLARRDEIVIATKVGLEMGPAPNSGGLSRKHILRRSTARSGGSAPIMSISTRFTGSTGRRRWRRSWPRSTRSCAPARRATSARRRCTRGSS